MRQINARRPGTAISAEARVSDAIGGSFTSSTPHGLPASAASVSAAMGSEKTKRPREEGRFVGTPRLVAKSTGLAVGLRSPTVAPPWGAVRVALLPVVDFWPKSRERPPSSALRKNAAPGIADLRALSPEADLNRPRSPESEARLTTIALERPETRVEPGYRGFLNLAEAAGLDLEPFQRRIARTALGPERELLVLLPRGNGKTCLQPWSRSTTC
jgi:hypothetical protein